MKDDQEGRVIGGVVLFKGARTQLVIKRARLGSFPAAISGSMMSKVAPSIR